MPAGAWGERSDDLAGLAGFRRGPRNDALLAAQPAGVFGELCGEIRLRHLGRVPQRGHAAPVEPQRAVAERLDVRDIVRDVNDGHAAAAHLVDLSHAALAEADVAHRQGFVHDQDVGVQVNCDRERQPHQHAARVGAHGLIDERADLRECQDLVELAVHLARRKAEDGAVQVDILPAGVFRVEAGAQLEQGGNAAVNAKLAGARLEDACDDLEQRALSRAVCSDHAESLAAADSKRDVAERPVLLVVAAAVQGQQLAQPVARAFVDGVLLRNGSEIDDVHRPEATIVA